MVNELMEHFKEQSVVNFISLLGESQYTARWSFELLEIFSDAQKACVLLNTARYGFQPLQMNWAASNLMFARTWQGMF